MTPQLAPAPRLLAKQLRKLYDEAPRSYEDVDDGYAERWNDWCDRLLAEGGERVVPPLVPDSLIGLLLVSAEQFNADRAVTAPGEESCCHSNASTLWHRQKDMTRAIGTGYALSLDGLWRQHSWALESDGTVIETMMPRTAYIGLRLAEEAAGAFTFANNPRLRDALLSYLARYEASKRDA